MPNGIKKPKGQGPLVPFATAGQLNAALSGQPSAEDRQAYLAERAARERAMLRVDITTKLAVAYAERTGQVIERELAEATDIVMRVALRESES